MRRFLLIAALWPAVGLAQVRPGGSSADGIIEVSGGGGGGGGWDGASNMTVKDDVLFQLGTGDDCWFEWDTGAVTHNLRLVCTDVDGIGTDGVICYVDAGTDDWVCVGSIEVASAQSFRWGSRADMSSPADGKILFDTNAGGQGIIFDAATTDGELLLQDEAGAACGLEFAGELHLDGQKILPDKDDADTSIQSASADSLTLEAGGAVISMTENTTNVLDLTSYYCQLDDNTQIRSGGADGNMILTNEAGTQGVKFDTTTTANYLILSDESGNDLSLQTEVIILDRGGPSYGSITRAAFNFNAGSGAISNLNNGGETWMQTRNVGGALATGDVYMFTGNQTLATDYDSGRVDIYTGTTATDGDTGDVNIWTGAAGAGAADAGDIYLKTHGTQLGLSILGSTGDIDIFSLNQADLGATCTTGQTAIDNGGATAELCHCASTNTWYCISFTTTSGPTD